MKAAAGLTSEREGPGNHGCLRGTQGSDSHKCALTQASGLSGVARDKNPGSKGAQSQGLACQLDWKSERTSDHGRLPASRTDVGAQPRSAEAEHRGTHLRLGAPEEKGEDEWRKIPHVMSDKANSDLGPRRERRISRLSMHVFQQETKSRVHTVASLL